MKKCIHALPPTDEDFDLELWTQTAIKIVNGTIFDKVPALKDE